MSKIAKDFVSQENRHFKWKMGNHIASSLSGFIAGCITASIVLYALFEMTWRAKSIIIP